MSKENSKLFCLEVVRDSRQENSRLFPMLEHIALQYDITSVYKSCDDIEGLEQSLSNLLYEDQNFKHYEIIYLVLTGSRNQIVIDGYSYRLEEIAELFEGKLNGKIVHFANSKILDIDLETAQYFLNVTRAKALSGYDVKHPIESLYLDSRLFAYYQETDNVTELVQLLLENEASAQRLGFKLYY